MAASFLFEKACLQRVTSAILHQSGFDRCSRSCLVILSDLVEYLFLAVGKHLGLSCKGLNHRTEFSVSDVALVLRYFLFCTPSTRSTKQKITRLGDPHLFDAEEDIWIDLMAFLKYGSSGNNSGNFGKSWRSSPTPESVIKKFQECLHSPSKSKLLIGRQQNHNDDKTTYFESIPFYAPPIPESVKLKRTKQQPQQPQQLQQLENEPWYPNFSEKDLEYFYTLEDCLAEKHFDLVHLPDISFSPVVQLVEVESKDLSSSLIQKSPASAAKDALKPISSDTPSTTQNSRQFHPYTTPNRFKPKPLPESLKSNIQAITVASADGLEDHEHLPDKDIVISPIEILNLSQSDYANKPPSCLNVQTLPIPLDLIRIPVPFTKVKPFPPANARAPWMTDILATSSPLAMDEGHGKPEPTSEETPSETLKSKLLLLLQSIQKE